MRFEALACACLGWMVALQTTAAPVFYISDRPLGIAQPSDMLNFDPQSSNSTEFGIYVQTDERLAGVSLDLLETGGGIRFTGVDVVNDDRWMFLDGPLNLSSSVITSIGGVAIPGLGGQGIGPGSEIAGFDPMSGYRIATVNYEIITTAPTKLSLRVGQNIVAGWNGIAPRVFSGDGTELVNYDPPPLPERPFEPPPFPFPPPHSAPAPEPEPAPEPTPAPPEEALPVETPIVDTPPIDPATVPMPKIPWIEITMIDLPFIDCPVGTIDWRTIYGDPRISTRIESWGTIAEEATLGVIDTDDDRVFTTQEMGSHRLTSNVTTFGESIAVQSTVPEPSGLLMVSALAATSLLTSRRIRCR